LKKTDTAAWEAPPSAAENAPTATETAQMTPEPTGPGKPSESKREPPGAHLAVTPGSTPLPSFSQIARIILVWLAMELSSPVFWTTALLILGTIVDALQHSGISDPLAIKLITILGVAYVIGTKIESALGHGKLQTSLLLHGERTPPADTPAIQPQREEATS
jgi:hypothetical protein